MIKENIRIINHLFDEVFKARNMQIIDELVAEEVINHEVTGIDRTPGLEGFRREIKLFLDAFPNAAISAEDIVAQNDKVVVRWRLQGNHGGEFAGIQATGRYVDVVGIIIYRLENRKIKEYWGLFDFHGLTLQLGVEE
jgi:steroid delta-isomerase-like uncharacterized protein